MGLYHTTALAYGFEIPTTTDLNEIDRALGEERNDDPDAVGYTVVGDCDRAVLCTRFTRVGENQIVPVIPETLASAAELAAWDSALHYTAERLGHPDHPEPRWLVIHNYR